MVSVTCGKRGAGSESVHERMGIRQGSISRASESNLQKLVQNRHDFTFEMRPSAITDTHRALEVRITARGTAGAHRAQMSPSRWERGATEREKREG